MPSALAPFAGDDVVGVVVGSPRHGTLQYEYVPDLGAVTASRRLAPGPIAVREKQRRRGIGNHRLVLRPAWKGATAGVDKIGALPPETVRELAQFFVGPAFFSGKETSVTGRRGSRAAFASVRRSRGAP